MEEIKKLEGFNDYYYISSYGYIITKNWRNSKREAIIKTCLDACGYKRTALMHNGKLKTIKIHRLVAISFIQNPENKPQVNHIDGNKQNNNINNLEWVNNSENQIHAYKIGLNKAKRGEENSKAILTEKQVKEIRSKFKKRVYTREMLGIEYGVKASTIKDIILRKSWKHI